MGKTSQVFWFAFRCRFGRYGIHDLITPDVRRWDFDITPADFLDNSIATSRPNDLVAFETLPGINFDHYPTENNRKLYFVEI